MPYTVEKAVPADAEVLAAISAADEPTPFRRLMDGTAATKESKDDREQKLSSPPCYLYLRALLFFFSSFFFFFLFFAKPPRGFPEIKNWTKTIENPAQLVLVVREDGSGEVVSFAEWVLPRDEPQLVVPTEEVSVGFLFLSVQHACR
jgi:hypothetical protein